MAGAMLTNSSFARKVQEEIHGRESPSPSLTVYYRDRPDFNPASHGLQSTFKLSSFSELRGRGCRVPPGMVEAVLGGLGGPGLDQAKVGVGTDCSITPIRRGGLASISSSEIFYPLIDDPYMMGRIACCSLLSDLYALGIQEVDNVLMYLGISARLSAEERDVVVPLMMKGFKEAAREAGSRVTGGQTLINPWMMVGGAATSICSQEEYIVPDQAAVGDVLVLTKPLGTGVAVNCHHMIRTERFSKVKLVMTEEELEKAYRRAVDTMARNNRTAALLMHKYSAHAATDISSLGLLGHATALARCQKNEVSLVVHNLPVIYKMAALAKVFGNMFGLNQGEASECCGGLLISLPREEAAAFCKEMERLEGYPSWIVGIVEAGDRTARIIEKPRVLEVPSKDTEDDLW